MARRLSPKDYEQLGKALERVLIRDHLEVVRNWKRFITISLVRGLFIGFGTVIGATLLITALVWVLSQLGQVPLIGELFENITETIQGR